MPLLADRVQETTATAGTGTLTLGGAVAGFQSFSSAFADQSVVYYAIVDPSNNWEVGIGLFTLSGTTLARTTVLASSNAGALVTLVTGASVFCTAAAESLQDLNNDLLIPLAQEIVPANSGAVVPGEYILNSGIELVITASSEMAII